MKAVEKWKWDMLKVMEPSTGVKMSLRVALTYWTVKLVSGEQVIPSYGSHWDAWWWGKAASNQSFTTTENHTDMVVSWTQCLAPIQCMRVNDDLPHLSFWGHVVSFQLCWIDCGWQRPQLGQSTPNNEHIPDPAYPFLHSVSPLELFVKPELPLLITKVFAR